MPLIYKLLSGVGVILIVFYLGQWKGRNDGKIEQLKDSVEAVQKRDKIDQDISRADDYSVCIAVGGLPEHCASVRRMEEAAASE